MWQPIETAPKNIVQRERMISGSNYHEYGPYILAAGGNCSPRRVRWWQASGDPERSCNFLGDCGNAYRPTHWMPLPSPPEDN